MDTPSPDRDRSNDIASDFAGFMRAYQNMVFSTAARIAGNDAHAEDIAQEVFLRAYENFGQLQNSPTAGGWLKRVATNLSLNHLSRYRRRWRLFSELRREDEGDEDNDAAADFGAVLADPSPASVDAGTRHTLIEQALRTLPEHQRVPIVLYHFEEMPYEEIARQLHISLAKVKIDILRGRAALAKQLARCGILTATCSD